MDVANCASKLWCHKRYRAFSQCQTCEVPLGTGILWLRMASSRHCHARVWKERNQVSGWSVDSSWFPVDSHGFWMLWAIWRNSCWFQGLHLGQSESSMRWSMTYQDCEVGTVPLQLGSCSLQMGIVPWCATKKTVNIGTWVWIIIELQWGNRRLCSERVQVQPRENHRENQFFLQDWHFDLTILRSLYWGRLWRLIAESMGWRKVLRPWWVFAGWIQLDKWQLIQSGKSRNCCI